MLGHKRIENTEIYTEGVAFDNDEWIVKRPLTREEEDKLIEAGFQYVRYDEKERTPIYRKAK